MENNLFKLHNDLILSKFKKQENINELSLKIFFKCIMTYKDFEQDFFVNEIRISDLIKTNNYKEVKKSIDNLQEQFIRVIENEKDQRYKTIGIFDTLDYRQGFLSFDFTKSIKPYITDIQNNYTMIDFENISKLNSFYSIKLYLLLKKDLYFNKNSYTINELYDYLQLNDYHREFKNFKRRILIKSMEDIDKNTTLHIKEIVVNKIGRKVNNIVLPREERKIDLIGFTHFLKTHFKHKTLMTHKPTKTEYYLNEKGLLTKDSLVMDKEESMKIYKYLYNHKEVYLNQIQE